MVLRAEVILLGCCEVIISRSVVVLLLLSPKEVFEISFVVEMKDVSDGCCSSSSSISSDILDGKDDDEASAASAEYDELRTAIPKGRDVIPSSINEYEKGFELL